ncbi:beta strand repeat-containing protein [Spiribacter salinus]|uniref:beta strand repeat-containing protein n=1 Tax=Spiribacter salinus TaxID=1335746 RepID=UPI001C93D8AD|nr:hypothetical protein [Spiribacter salinus]MBY5268834.1 hypothetical protein [Spiribacter salinus]
MSLYEDISELFATAIDGQDNEAIVKTAYEDLLGYTDADTMNNAQARIDYWVGKLASGDLTADTFGGAFLEEANTNQGDLISATTFANNQTVVEAHQTAYDEDADTTLEQFTTIASDNRVADEESEEDSGTPGETFTLTTDALNPATAQFQDGDNNDTGLYGLDLGREFDGLIDVEISVDNGQVNDGQGNLLTAGGAALGSTISGEVAAQNFDLSQLDYTPAFNAAGTDTLTVNVTAGGETTTFTQKISVGDTLGNGDIASDALTGTDQADQITLSDGNITADLVVDGGEGFDTLILTDVSANVDRADPAADETKSVNGVQAVAITAVDDDDIDIDTRLFTDLEFINADLDAIAGNATGVTFDRLDEGVTVGVSGDSNDNGSVTLNNRSGADTVDVLVGNIYDDYADVNMDGLTVGNSTGDNVVSTLNVRSDFATADGSHTVGDITGAALRTINVTGESDLSVDNHAIANETVNSDTNTFTVSTADAGDLDTGIITMGEGVPLVLENTGAGDLTVGTVQSAAVANTRLTLEGTGDITVTNVIVDDAANESLVLAVNSEGTNIVNDLDFQGSDTLRIEGSGDVTVNTLDLTLVGGETLAMNAAGDVTIGAFDSGVIVDDTTFTINSSGTGTNVIEDASGLSMEDDATNDSVLAITGDNDLQLGSDDDPLILGTGTTLTTNELDASSFEGAFELYLARDPGAATNDAQTIQVGTGDTTVDIANATTGTNEDTFDFAFSEDGIAGVTIENFSLTDAQDLLDFGNFSQANGFADDIAFGDLTIEQDGSDAVITADDYFDGSITLAGIDVDDIDAQADFVFAA